MANVFMQLLYRVLAMVSRETPSSFRTDVTESAKRGAEAFGEGRVIEATYWMVMADLGGMRNLDLVIADYAVAWVAKGCPGRDESPELTEYQQAFALSALRWFSNKDMDNARAWFENAAAEGNRDAAVFLHKHTLAAH